MQVPWVEKYRPKHVKEIVGNEKAVREFLSWLNGWIDGRGKKAVFLYGPPGCGKTSLVYAAARDFNLELIEVNASDKRDKSKLESLVRLPSLLLPIYQDSRMRLYLLDELEGISGKEDVGGLSEIIRIVKEPGAPVVLIANDLWQPNFAPLRNLCKTIEFRKIHKRIVVKVLKEICAKEGIIVDPEVLRIIADSSKGDLRAAINDLQMVAQGKKSLKLSDLGVIGYRNRELGIFEVLGKIFYSKNCKDAINALSSSEVDYGMMIRWISENIPRFFTTFEEIYEAYDKLAEATLFLNRAKVRGNWRLLPYMFSLMSAGVAMSRKYPTKGFIKSKYPSWVKLQSRMRKKKAILDVVAEAIGKRCHVSKRRVVLEYLPYLAMIYRSDERKGKSILRWLNVEEDLFLEAVEDFF
ncbi:MAG: replication factor C large subunit [Candidatus Asgardarchaeia archaeon]